MEQWVATCLILENPNDRNSRIVGLGIVPAVEQAHSPLQVPVEELGPDIEGGLKGVSVVYKVGSDTKFSSVYAHLQEDRWILQTKPDGFEPGNLRSLLSC